MYANVRVRVNLLVVGVCVCVCVLLGFLFLRVFLQDQVIAGTIMQNRVWVPIFFNE